MQVTNGKIGSQTIRVYMCSWHRDRGDAVCTNTLRRPVAAVDEAIISWIQQHVLTEGLIIETLKEVRRRIADCSKVSDSEVPGLEAELKTLKAEIDRLTVAPASTDEKPHAIVKAIGEKERRSLHLKTRIEALRATPAVVNMEIEALEEERARRSRNCSMRRRANPDEARMAMDALLDGPLSFTPIEVPGGKRYKIEGPVAIGNLFVTEPEPGFKLCATPTGFEPVLPA